MAVWFLLAGLGLLTWADETSEVAIRAAEGEAYRTRVRHVLHERCIACHGALKQEAGLRLDTARLTLAGGESGPVVVPGNATESLLIERVTAELDSRMPPEGEPLTSDQIADLRNWIDAGAPHPDDEEPEADPREHWAFRPPSRPPVPTPLDPWWRDHPVDAFLRVEQEKHGLTPRPPADRRLLLRRVWIDLVGMPPSLEELDHFARDPAPDAYEQAVDRLLASSHYGERWGRHWMDIWRYSDWWGLGAELRNSQKHLWHWRDWIVESLNADKGYDQMMREMLAADELYPTEPDRLRATGFLARHYYLFNRTTWLDETIEHTAKAMLGLTFNCAKCHDHKYDPISQVEYYQFRAFFEPYQVRTDLVPGEVDPEKNGIPRAFDGLPDVPTYLHVRGDDRQADTSRPLSPRVPAILAYTVVEPRPIQLPAEAHTPGLRPWVLEGYLAAADRAIEQAQREWEATASALSTAEGTSEAALAAVTLAERTLERAHADRRAIEARSAAMRAPWTQPPLEEKACEELAHRAAQAEGLAQVALAREAISRAHLARIQAPEAQHAAKDAEIVKAQASLSAAEEQLAKAGSQFTLLAGARKARQSNLETEDAARAAGFPTTSTGRRAALALWLTDPRHPLPARVAVNHVWARHFGQPLVATVFDFGRKGASPTHPELLDWLAVELIESGWSLKHLHRLIVTSRAYRMAATTGIDTRENERIDPENQRLWRFPAPRMEAEVVRDALLTLAGRLDPTLGGPTLPITDDSRRRSLYYFHSHNDEHRWLAMFDSPNVLDCYRRPTSIVPQQALALVNSPFTIELSESIAKKAGANDDSLSDAEYAQRAFRTLLATDPTPEELAVLLDSLVRWRELSTAEGSPAPIRDARIELIRILINHNDFITIR